MICYLKPNPLFRSVIIWSWRNIYPVYVRYIAILAKSINAKRWRPLIKLTNYAILNQLTPITLLPAAVVETPAPKVFPSCKKSYLKAPHDQFVAPAISVATINSGIIYGGTNLVLSTEGVICHDLYEFARDSTIEELHGRVVINPKSSRIRWLFYNKPVETVPAAASFVDACSGNYAHWLTEVLPRIALFCSIQRFSGVPVVVDEGLHNNIMESLFLVAGCEREIIAIPTDTALAVDQLHLTSVTGYVPFGRRTTGTDGHSAGKFSPPSLDLVRVLITQLLEKQPQQKWPKKIYIRRSSLGPRRVLNGEQLEKLLVAHGFVVVEPESFSFLQQVQLFANAETIVGASGAGLANIVFSPPSTKIYILISQFSEHSYWYWQNIACASGKSVNYVFGEISKKSDGIHADFFITLEDVLRAINEQE